MTPSRSTTFAVLIAGLAYGLAVSPQAAEECLPGSCTAFPAAAGVINVRSFGAMGDGVHDDTAAILAAIKSPLPGQRDPSLAHAFYDAPIIYFPKGTYLVSDTLSKRYSDGRYADGMMLVGAARGATTIRLANASTGYADPKAPKAIVYTSSTLFNGSPTSGGKDYTGKGEGNDAYLNYVENITIDAGYGNPGAIGIDYLASNIGAIRDVAVKSGDGQGAIGIALLRKWIGPALLDNVVVDGFDVGIDVANPVYSVTMDTIRLAHQKVAGLRNDQNIVAIRHLDVETDGDAPAILNQSPNGLIVVDGASLKNHSRGIDAIDNAGYLNLRQVAVEGFPRVLGQLTPVTRIDGIYSGNERLSGSRVNWSITEQEPVSPTPENPGQWVSVTAYGAHSDGTGDATTAIQAAFASGARTIYFPYGVYTVHSGVDIPASVERVEGMMSVIHFVPPRSPGFSAETGLLRAHSDKTPLLIEKLIVDATGTGRQVGIETLGRGALTIRDVAVMGATIVRPKTGGLMFLENVAFSLLDIAGPQPVRGWQLDTEGGGTRIRNEGSPLWILGLKTEGNCTVLENKSGAVTEILGALLYPVRPFADPTIPAFINSDGKLLASYAEAGFVEGSTYSVHLLSTLNGVETRVDATSLPLRHLRLNAGARIVPRLITGGGVDKP